jgi:carboxypeptidase D
MEISNGRQPIELKNNDMRHCFEITIELSCCKYPPVNRLSIEWKNNRESLMNIIDINITPTPFIDKNISD